MKLAPRRRQREDLYYILEDKELFIILVRSHIYERGGHYANAQKHLSKKSVCLLELGGWISEVKTYKD